MEMAKIELRAEGSSCHPLDYASPQHQNDYDCKAFYCNTTKSIHWDSFDKVLEKKLALCSSATAMPQQCQGCATAMQQRCNSSVLSLQQQCLISATAVHLQCYSSALVV